MTMREFELLSQIERKEVKWLWEPYIPRAMMTIIEGDPDVGKSYLAMHLASIVSSGGKLPNGESLTPGKVLYFSQEDDPAYTIRPRVEDMGGNLRRIKVHVGDSLFDEFGLKVIEEEVERWKPDLIIVDPLVAYIDAGADMYRSNEIRPILRRLSEIAAIANAAIVPIRHLVKGKTTKAIYQGGGSMDFIAFVRSALRVAVHPERGELRVLVHFKHNLSKRGESLAYELVEQSPPKRPVVQWRGKTDVTIEQLHEGGQRQPSELEHAMSFLRKVLANGPVGATQVEEKSEAHSISKRTLERAKKELKVQAKRKGAAWYWTMPEKK